MKTAMKGVLIFTLLFSQPLLALTLNEAREQGLVDETLSGYIGPIKQDQETQRLVKSINKARAEHYQQLADSNNISVDEVAKLAGQKLVTRARAAWRICAGHQRSVDEEVKLMGSCR